MAVSVSMTAIFTKPHSLFILVQFVWGGARLVYLNVAFEKRNISGVQRYNWVSERFTISEKYWGEVGKEKRADVYLEERKRRGHIFFEWNKCLCTETRNPCVIASIAKCELNNNMCVRRWINTCCIYDQYQPEMDSKFRHRMDNRSEVQEIAF